MALQLQSPVGPNPKSLSLKERPPSPAPCLYPEQAEPTTEQVFTWLELGSNQGQE